MDTTLEGRWYYRSFRQAPPAGLQEGPQLLPWSPPGVLEAVTGEHGQLMGMLVFAPDIRLQCCGHLLPASAERPAALELSGAGLGAHYELKGYFVPGSDHVVGTIVCLRGDLAGQPDDTGGPFVLYPLRAAMAAPPRAPSRLSDGRRTVPAHPAAPPEADAGLFACFNGARIAAFRLGQGRAAEAGRLSGRRAHIS